METMFYTQSVLLLYNENQLDLASLEAQPITSRKSAQAPNVNNSSLKYMLKVVAKVFQQITTELNGSASEENRIMAVTKTVLKLMKKNGC
jgi:hypothetical protein